MNYIECPPNAYALMDSVRSMGYTIETAVADILDNSIAGKAKNIDVYFGHNPLEYIAIIDDGEGMDRLRMEEAMRYGGKGTGNARDNHDLGRFGLGLKTASLSQCDKLTVVSKTANRAMVGMRWDLQHIQNQNAANAWKLEILGEDEIYKLPMAQILTARESGTMVLWESLEPMKQGEDRAKDILGRKMEATAEHLSLVFHRYLAGESGLEPIHIRWNGGNELTPVNPFHGSVVFSPPTLLLPSDVMLTTYLMPHPSSLNAEDKTQLGITRNIRQNQGFYVYRNKRLIQWGSWYRIMPRDKVSELLRFKIDIANDCDNDKEWLLDVKKSQITPPNMSLEILKNIAVKIHDEVKGSWVRQEYSSPDEAEEKQLWEMYSVGTEKEKKVFYKINENHPLVEQIKYGMKRREKEDFDRLLRLLAKTVPIQQMTLACEQDSIDENNRLSQEEVSQMLETYLEQFTGEERELQKNVMRVTVPFSYYPDLFE